MPFIFEDPRRIGTSGSSAPPWYQQQSQSSVTEHSGSSEESDASSERLAFQVPRMSVEDAFIWYFIRCGDGIQAWEIVVLWNHFIYDRYWVFHDYRSHNTSHFRPCLHQYESLGRSLIPNDVPFQRFSGIFLHQYDQLCQYDIGRRTAKRGAIRLLDAACFQAGQGQAWTVPDLVQEFWETYSRWTQERRYIGPPYTLDLVLGHYSPTHTMESWAYRHGPAADLWEGASCGRLTE